MGKTYCTDNFEMCEFSATKYSSSIRNILARLKALLAKGIKQEHYLPRLITFVIDDNLIRQSGITKSEAKSNIPDIGTCCRRRPNVIFFLM